MDFPTLLTIFTLACVVGYFVVWGVTPALHTPLMAVTNAISGIVIIAALALTATHGTSETLCNLVPCTAPGKVEGYHTASIWLGSVAVFLCALNIFGGFAITRRMLAMFKPKAK
ncbi:MAG: pyridine nucleotide transhydrogenase [Alphaproteobacteria bacterium CG_4_10_14_0_8_um_filter_53_9]|nr:MAG: pyridine nucleotide transhydrogenase [Alphaproteobacteria bacterium CG_4_10_14_0_8_um_filter_53_9]